MNRSRNFKLSNFDVKKILKDLMYVFAREYRHLSWKRFNPSGVCYVARGRQHLGGIICLFFLQSSDQRSFLQKRSPKRWIRIRLIHLHKLYFVMCEMVSRLCSPIYSDALVFTARFPLKSSDSISVSRSEGGYMVSYRLVKNGSYQAPVFLYPLCLVEKGHHISRRQAKEYLTPSLCCIR